MTNSILNSTKKILNIPADYTAFDLDVMTHINGVLSTLEQIGVGPVGGFMIEDDTAEWRDLLGDDPRLNSVKNLVYFKVRLAFDPPTTSFAISALQEQARELEWRLNVTVDTRPMLVLPDSDYVNGEF